jgi:hypothetical protein
MEHIDQKCPLCSRPAKYCYTDHADKKYFRCDYCTDFQLCVNVEDLVANMPNTWRQEASRVAHESVYEQILLIKMVKISELAPGESPFPVKHFCPRAMIQQCT